MAHPYQNYAGAYPSQNAYSGYYLASGNAHAHTPHDQPMLYQPFEYLPGAGMLVSSGVMAPAQEPASAVTPRPRTRNPHYDLETQHQQAGSSHTAVPAVMPPQDLFGYHPPHLHPQSTFQHSAFTAQPSLSIAVAPFTTTTPSDYTYTIEPALVPLSPSAGQSTTQRRASVREPATRPARVGTLAPDSLLFQPFVPKFTQPQAAPQQPQPVVEVVEDDAWLQFLAQYPPTSLGF